MIRSCVCCSRLEWMELLSELSYNHMRTAVFQDGCISMYQVGSPTLGLSAAPDDIEKGLVQFDVFKTAKLRDLKVSARV